MTQFSCSDRRQLKRIPANRPSPLDDAIETEELEREAEEAMGNPADAPISYALDTKGDPYWEDPYSWCHIPVFADGVPIMPGETTPFDSAIMAA